MTKHLALLVLLALVSTACSRGSSRSSSATTPSSTTFVVERLGVPLDFDIRVWPTSAPATIEKLRDGFVTTTLEELLVRVHSQGKAVAVMYLQNHATMGDDTPLPPGTALSARLTHAESPHFEIAVADHERAPEGLRFLSIPSVFQDQLKVDAAVIERTLAAERALEAFWNGEPITDAELVDDVRLLVDTSPMHRLSAPVDGPRVELPTGTGLRCVALIRTIDGALTAMPDSCAPWLGPNSSRLLADDGRTLAHYLTYIDEADSTGRRHIAAEFGHGTMVRATFERHWVEATVTLFDVDGEAAPLERELWRANRPALVFDELTPGRKRLRVESKRSEGANSVIERDFEVREGACFELQMP